MSIPIWLIVLGVASKSLSIGKTVIVERISARTGKIDTRPWVYNIALISLMGSATYYLWLNLNVVYEPVSLLGHLFGFLYGWRFLRISRCQK